MRIRGGSGAVAPVFLFHAVALLPDFFLSFFIAGIEVAALGVFAGRAGVFSCSPGVGCFAGRCLCALAWC